ncbi:MAG: homocysteine S-methyltransferase family protein [Opitutales bacterium]
MNKDFFKKIRILDAGMGQELLARGLVSKGTLWSATSLIDEKYYQLVIDTHLSSIKAGADVILTNTFTTRKVRMEQNQVGKYFHLANKKACELAIKAKELSKKNILIAGSLPAQNDTYAVDKRDKNIIENNFFEQANILNPHIDFFYLDVLSSGREIEIALNATQELNKLVLVGMHIKKNGKLPSGETITEVVQKYKNDRWLGVISACVSLEIIEKTSNEFKKLGIPFGFKANLWGVEEPLPVHKFNTAGFNEIGKNPNITLGKRDEVTNKVFGEFAKKIIKNGATILGGCCETNDSHIKEIAKLKYHYF